MFRKSFALVCLLLVGGLFLSGCGSIESASVAVTASGTTVDATDAITLTAVVTNDTNSAGVTWTVTGGGTLSNTTTSAATYTAPAASSTALTVTVTATSVADATKSGSATITVPAKPAITTGALAAGTVGTAYSAAMAGSGGIGPYTWTITSGTFPAGLGMNSAGVISGTPTAPGVGTTNLTFVLTDSGKATALTSSVTLGLTVNAALAIAFTGLVPATATYNVAYTGSAAAGGGAGALTYSVASGALPTGLNLNAANGAIIGTPTATGTFNFSIRAADAFGDSNTQGYSIVVSYPAVVVTPATLPTGYVQSVYHQSTLAATGGSGTGFSFALANGTLLPAGLNLSSAGVITGTPTATGTTNFTVTATDSASNSGNGNFSITVNAGVSISTSLTLPTGYVGSSYSQTLAATGGSGTGYTWTVTGGSTLPAVLSLSTAGVLSGKPTTTGTPSFSITATDSVGNTASATFSMTIAAGVSINVPTLPTGYPGTSYPGTTLTASGGTNTGFTWSWAAAGGSTLPAGLNIGSTTGAITGTPTNSTSASVVSSVVVTATDSVGNQSTATISVTIEATVAITTATLPGATIGVNYSQPLAASGGSGSYTSWQVTTGAPSLTAIGLALNTSTGVISGASPTSGTAIFSVAVTDSQGHVSTAASFTVVASSALVVTTASLNQLNVGQTPTQVMAAAGGSGIIADYSWSWTAAGGSSLPPGLTMGANGAVGGSPTTAGTYSVVVKVQDSGSSTSNTVTLSITINSAMSLSANSTLPAGYTGVAYSGTIAASGGSGSYCFTVPTAAQYTAGIWDGLQTSLPNLPPSGGCNYLGGSSLSLTGTPTNPPAPPYNIPLSISVTDETTGQTITRVYSISVTAPSAPSLPASSLTAATVSQSYTGSVTATGGIGPNYVWTINGTALATNGSPVSITDGLTVSNNGTNVLTIGGTPTSVSTTPGVQFTAQVKDTTTGLTSGAATTYTIVVNAAGSNVSGQISMNGNCGPGGTVPTITLNLLTNPGGTVVQTQTTGGSGNYTFTSIPNGNYTISPSITGPSSLFSPATQNVTVSNGTLSGENFQVSLGYTVSGTVSYGGSNTGRIYLTLNSTNCGGNGATGTSIAAAGAFTIRGVPPGSYNLQAYMGLATLGNAFPNTSDPTGSTSGLTVSNANLTGQTITLTDNTPTSVPSSNPSFNAITPTDQGVVITYSPVKSNVNGATTEGATSYDVQWSTSSSFTSPVVHNFKAIGKSADVWMLSNGTSGVSGSSFSNGTPYYFEIRARNSVGPAASWVVYGGGTPTAVTPGASTSGIQVQGTVTIPNGITPSGPLYAGFYNQNTNTVYGMRIAAPTAGANNYTVYLPSDSNPDYINFAVLDQNNDGLIDAGDVSNTGDNQSNGIAITSALTGQDPPLPNANSTATVITQYYQSTSSGGSSTGYNLSFDVRGGNKLPVAVTLSSGPNTINPIDISVCNSCGNSQFDYSSSIGNAVPSVGDTYDFTVTYSDGSQDTGSTVNGAVTAFGTTGAVAGASDLVTNLSPNGTSSTSLTPTLSWTYPAGASSANYVYSFYFSDSNGNTIWQLPNQSSNSNGFSYAQDPTGTLTWNVDPIPGDNSSVQGSLNTTTQYNWQIQVQDSLGNSAQAQTWYQP